MAIKKIRSKINSNPESVAVILGIILIVSILVNLLLLKTMTAVCAV